MLRRTLPPVRLAICLPGSSYSYWWLASWNELYGSLLLDGYDVTLVPGQGTHIHEIRDQIVDKLFAVDAEYVLWIDSDNLFSRAGFDALIRTLDSTGAAMVCGWYLAATDPPIVNAGIGDHRITLDEIEDAAGALLDIDTSGFGFVLMRKSALLDLGRFPFNPISKPEGGSHGDDASFCLRARAAGLRILLHSGVYSEHMKLQPVPCRISTLEMI